VRRRCADGKVQHSSSPLLFGASIFGRRVAAGWYRVNRGDAGARGRRTFPTVLPPAPAQVSLKRPRSEPSLLRFLFPRLGDLLSRHQIREIRGDSAATAVGRNRGNIWSDYTGRSTGRVEWGWWPPRRVCRQLKRQDAASTLGHALFHQCGGEQSSV
jgi:hypothetical protein